MSEAKRTTDHEEIRKWVEGHDGKPSRVKGTGGKDDGGLLRINFPGYSGEDTLEEIPWDDFFKSFDDNELAFLYSDEGDSKFNKFVSR